MTNDHWWWGVRCEMSVTSPPDQAWVTSSLWILIERKLAHWARHGGLCSGSVTKEVLQLMINRVLDGWDERVISIFIFPCNVGLISWLKKFSFQKSSEVIISRKTVRNFTWLKQNCTTPYICNIRLTLMFEYYWEEYSLENSERIYASHKRNQLGIGISDDTLWHMVK